LDNIPPEIDRSLSQPKLPGLLEYYTTDEQVFRILLKSGEDVVYEWYLDGILQENESNALYYLSMENLQAGTHNLTMNVKEPSGLKDSMTWNFSVLQAPPDNVDDPQQNIEFVWLALVIIILVVLALLIFGIRYSYRTQEVKRTINEIPSMGTQQAISAINKKREQGDKYVLSKLVKDLPEVLKSNPDKLFIVLGMLAKDDISEVRMNAGRNIAKLLDNHPQNVLSWFKNLQVNKVKPEIYKTITKNVQNKSVKGLADCYHRLLTAKDEEQYISALDHSCNQLKLLEGQNIKFLKEQTIIFLTLNDFYKYRTISKISTSKPYIDRIKNLNMVVSELLNPSAIEVFSILDQIAVTLVKYEKVDGVEDKLSYLSHSLNLLEKASRHTRENLRPPERDLFFLVLDSWRNIITLSIRELRGRADFNLNLIGREVMADQDRITLMLEIENTGRSTAERVLVQVVPSNEYTILSKAQEIGSVGQKKKREVTFELRPHATEAFRVEFTINYDDAEKKAKSISFGDLITFIAAGAEFNEIPNPYIVGTPIKPGSKLFVGRMDLIDFIKKNIKGSQQENIIVLIGHRRTGKTTLLKQLPVYMDKQYVPVYIDIQGIIDPGMDAFFYLLSIEITKAMQQRGFEIEKPKFSDFKDRPSFYFEYQFLEDVYSKLGDSSLVLMFDEFEELETKVDSGLLDKNIFSYLRHLMQHTQKLAFIFTGTFRLEDLKTDYWSIMFNIALYKRVTFLSKSESKELITEPVTKFGMVYDSLAIEKIYRLTSGHPYFTQLLCHAMVDLHNSEKKNYITIQDVNGELNRIIERGQMHFDFLWDQAPILERLVMTALNRTQQEDDAVTVSMLVNKIFEYGINVDANDISKTLDTLAGKDIINKILDHTTTFEFKIDLIRIWLEHTKHLDQVVEEYRANQ
jgi:AAA+ ATPase superfamily predicted ATPase